MDFRNKINVSTDHSFSSCTNLLYFRIIFFLFWILYTSMWFFPQTIKWMDSHCWFRFFWTFETKSMYHSIALFHMRVFEILVIVEKYFPYFYNLTIAKVHIIVTFYLYIEKWWSCWIYKTINIFWFFKIKYFIYLL